MKSITIHQPWATLIALGEKQYETRSWQINYRGPLAIHAGKKVDREACEWEPIKSTLAKHGYTTDNLPTGAVVAIANLSECWFVGLDYERSLMPYLFNFVDGSTKRRRVSLKEDKFGDYTDGRFAWQMSDVQRLPEPIPAKGQQGLWNWDGQP
ncbi:ASCH domain-containing protein [Paenibacillus bouchesdurhonensis]|uniref:ASCH domain-containing protein n=1 Tax=Paenibacillus bouchesdurhonensis TaxID=1870990 RepID=UPI000DA604F4|nr:ASCH domain-containing protein [Paenibacillus bouchesdurhonensis]